MDTQSIKYNEQISVITGQSRIKQEILYTINNEKNAVFQIIGSAGTGKTTLSEVIARDFISQYNGNVFYLNPVYQEIPEDYSTFKALLHQNNQNKKILLNIFKESIKDIPYVGNSLSAITSQIISPQIINEEFGTTFAESEEYIISVLLKYQKNTDILYICNSYELWDFRSQQLLLHMIEHMEYNNVKNRICFIINSPVKMTGFKKTKIIYSTFPPV